MMEKIEKIDSDDFKLNEEDFLHRTREHYCLKNMQEVERILSSQPFNYPDDICAEIAVNVVKGGEILMENADESDEEDDDRCDIINKIGQEFNSLHHFSFLVIHNNSEECDKEKGGNSTQSYSRIFPQQDKSNSVTVFRSEIAVDSHSEAISEVKKFLANKGAWSFITHVVFTGKTDADFIYYKKTGKVATEHMVKDIQELYIQSDNEYPARLNVVYSNDDDFIVCMFSIQKKETKEKFLITDSSSLDNGFSEGITFDAPSTMIKGNHFDTEIECVSFE